MAMTSPAVQERSLMFTNFVCVHLGDIHVDEDCYFGGTAQCLEWFAGDGMSTAKSGCWPGWR
jgi:hypothetical protein